MSSFIERYHELTKYDPRTIDRLGDVHWKEQPAPFKEIAGQEGVDLRPYLNFLKGDDTSLWKEQGLRSGGEFDLGMLARLCWFSAGINGMIANMGQPIYLRATPSAGGLYPIEMYWAVFSVPGIDPGLYLFHPLRLSLVPVWKGQFRGDLESIFGNHSSLHDAQAMCVLTGTFSRSAWRYKERAYRRMLLDAGHLAGNLQCMVHEEQLQSFPLTGFVDQALSDLLFLDEGEEVPLLGIAVGKTLRISSSGAARSPIPEPDQLRVPEGVPFQLHAHRLGRISQLPLEHLPHAACASPLRADAEYQPLPDPLPILTENLPAVLALRRSCRRYQPQKMYLQDLSSILRYTWQTLMATPSAATQDRHLDTWLSVHNVDGLAPGIWHFDPAGHALTLVREGDFRNQVGTVCLGQTLGTQAAVVFFHTSPLAHAVASCGERIYRALCLDAGHIGQRLNLAAESIGLGFSGIGGYFDDEANALLGIPASEAIVYVSTLGVPAQEDA